MNLKKYCIPVKLWKLTQQCLYLKPEIKIFVQSHMLKKTSHASISQSFSSFWMLLTQTEPVNTDFLIMKTWLSVFCEHKSSERVWQIYFMFLLCLLLLSCLMEVFLSSLNHWTPSRESNLSVRFHEDDRATVQTVKTYFQTSGVRAHPSLSYCCWLVDGGVRVQEKPGQKLQVKRKKFKVMKRTTTDPSN